MNRKPVIAVDGYSSTGKSSISKIIAEKLGIIHLDTGALYRAITYFGLLNFAKGDGTIDLELLNKNLDKVNLTFERGRNAFTILLNCKNISEAIRTFEVSNMVSHVAREAEVREFLLKTQQNMAAEGGVILDGRDIGTVVLPDADFKFFMTASPQKRAQRRFDELRMLGQNISLDEVTANLLERDRIDSTREMAPLRQAQDAIVIDNTDLDKDGTVDLILSYIHN